MQLSEMIRRKLEGKHILNKKRKPLAGKGYEQPQSSDQGELDFNLPEPKETKEEPIQEKTINEMLNYLIELGNDNKKKKEYINKLNSVEKMKLANYAFEIYELTKDMN